jgi:hypothetical protein|eukprot:COSAG06_NODE_1258_length_10078_cov_2.895280_5_plen_52_part_00
MTQKERCIFLQFHPNTVLGRWVPPSYTGDLKAAQEKAGRMELQGCADGGAR